MGQHGNTWPTGRNVRWKGLKSASREAKEARGMLAKPEYSDHKAAAFFSLCMFGLTIAQPSWSIVTSQHDLTPPSSLMQTVKLSVLIHLQAAFITFLCQKWLVTLFPMYWIPKTTTLVSWIEYTWDPVGFFFYVDPQWSKRHKFDREWQRGLWSSTTNIERQKYTSREDGGLISNVIDTYSHTTAALNTVRMHARILNHFK